jgi:long-chain acyl-CoA synthetase
VPTITLTSSILLNQVLESHPPNAIIVEASFLERVLELLAESLSNLVVVVVNDKKGELKRLKSKAHARLVPWEDLESFDGVGPSVGQPGQRYRLCTVQRCTNSSFRCL